MGMFTGAQSYQDYQTEVRRTFTPGTPAVGEMYIPRDEVEVSAGNYVSVQESMADTLQHGQFQVLLYGDSGVGKTNLLSWACKTYGLEKKVINVRESQSYEKAIEKAIRHIAGDIDIETGGTQETSKKVSGHISAGLKKILDLGGTAERGSVSSVNTKKLEVDLDELLAYSMYLAGVNVLIFDNLQNFKSSESRSQLGALMEYFADLGQEFEDWNWHPKIAAAGIATNGVDLIDGNQSRARRVKQFKVEHMADNKIRQIVTTGFDRLKIEATPELIEEIVFYSDGFPYFTHDLCQRAVLGRNVYDSRKVTKCEIDAAIKGMFGSERDEMRALLKLVRGRKSNKRFRAKVLDIIVKSSWSEWSSRQVYDEWRRLYSDAGTTRHGDITIKLNEMSDKGRKMDILVRSGTEAEYEYRFKDPHFRPYARMHPEESD